MEYKLELKLKEKEFDVRPISIEINPPKILENKEIQIKKIEVAKSQLIIFFDCKEKISNFESIAKIMLRLKDFMISVWDVSLLIEEEAYDQYIYFFECNEWREVIVELEINPVTVNYTKVNINEHAQELIDYIFGENNLPFSLTLLKKSKVIQSPRERFVTMITACEIGVKEFYQKEKPDTRFLLENMQSPPIVKLLGTMFESYFGCSFPKELRKEIDGLVKKRNDFVHSAKEGPSIDECYNCYSIVLQTLNFLYKISNSYLYNALYDERVVFVPTGINQSQMVLTDLAQKEVAQGNASISTNINITKNYRKVGSKEMED
ncbi:hypothetical protein OHE40_10730 [Enterococcus faecium]|uniref:hypothetical protein n=1 Tax=Enterococcus faecium TaxID=1352 RepID=UPI00136CCC90|nr:hypothetical protein [Enterococcus faecium]MBG8100064.1 hypothetical protein [Enterococcus faecium]MCV3195492.1 hypothetical protein [Enterococcus faecium]MCV6665527.1 hypothetical protein [Enterococcus faecium]MCW0175634.1 hypothetical protein [Enterococcus faecium]MDH2765191.1 hypothetical protein [Enterococcus faecium]